MRYGNLHVSLDPSACAAAGEVGAVRFHLDAEDSASTLLLASLFREAQFAQFSRYCGRKLVAWLPPFPALLTGHLPVSYLRQLSYDQEG